MKEMWNVDSTWRPFYMFELINKYNEWLAASCEHIINDNKLTKEMRNENFDLAISEAFTPCSFGIFKYYNITKFVAVMSGIAYDSHYEDMGINFPVSQVPSIFAPISSVMNFEERIYNLLFHLSVKFLYWNGVTLGNNIFKKYNLNINVENIFKECSFYISNTDPIVNYGVPGSPKMLQLGGFLLDKSKPLNEYYDKILNIRKQNVIISFGTFAKSSDMASSARDNLLYLFKAFPDISFIYKYTSKDISFLNGFDNVYPNEWIPQQSLLNDKRITAFIMHGGENSLLEASRAGVPMLAIPIFFDQPRNAKMIEVLKLGRWVDKIKLIKDPLYLHDTFKDVIENPLYKDTAKKIARMIKKRPYNEKELFLNHINFACEFVYNPVYSASHSNFMIKVADILVEAGHDVTILNAPINPSVKDTYVQLSKVAKPSNKSAKVESHIKKIDEQMKNVWIEDHTWNPLNTLLFLMGYSDWIVDSCEHILLDKDLAKEMKNKKFDLGISEFFFPCGFGILKYYNISKVISVNSGIIFDSHYANHGLTFPIAQVPSMIAPVGQVMTFGERIFNLLSYISIKCIHEYAVYTANTMYATHWPEGNIDINELFSKSIFFISNTDPIVNYGAPLSPKILQLGGFQYSDVQPLSPYFDRILNYRKINVIISFGSIAKSIKMPEHIRKNILKLFDTFPNITFIWKYEAERPSFLAGYDNVITSKWIPQNSLLNDQRVNLFLTHVGQNSFTEATRAGVPLLCFPIFFDQPRNGRLIEQLKLGRWIDKTQFANDYEILYTTFKDVLENPLYKENAKRVSEMIKNRPYNLKEMFIKHVEFGARFGEVENFNVPNRNIPWYQYTMIDIAVVFIITMIIIGYLVIKLIYLIKNITKRKDVKVD
uniref:glucuronosyltransferase n=1 Tax=Parastrongyloides trichosuri TaxID=131310 RepID=A0A0N4ZJ48_PARTI